MDEEKKPKGPGGRPEKYKPEYCELVRRLMSKGETIAACCVEIGVPRQTLIQWQKRHPEFREACELGKEDAQRWWERLAMTVATGAAHQKRKTGDQNTDHLKKANPKMISFLMARRFEDYQARSKTEIKADVNAVTTVVYQTQLADGVIRQSITDVETDMDKLVDEVMEETCPKSES